MFSTKTFSPFLSEFQVRSISAEPDLLMEAYGEAAWPNDPLYEKQWHLRAMGAPTGWTATRKGDGVIVAVIDTGVSKVEDLEGETQLERQEALFVQAIDNIRPSVEVRSKRVGGANYQVPREVKRSRQQALAIRWFVDNARKKKGKPMHIRLSEEIVDAFNGTGASVTWKENVHKMAEANKAYAHFAR